MSLSRPLPHPEVPGDVHPDQRERKFLLDAETAREFWAVASAHLSPWVHDAARPFAYARTTYFDTYDHAYYRSTRGPIARRLRVREYAAAATADGAPVLSGDCFLELKQSVGGLRAKSRTRVDPAEVPARLARTHAAPLLPCFTSWYRRAVLIHERERVRVTLDDRVAYYAPARLGSACGGSQPPRMLAHGPAFVLEVKLWDQPVWLARALEGIPEAVGFSKFLRGMQAAEARGLLTVDAAATAWSRA
jgi:hypothetical protein